MKIKDFFPEDLTPREEQLQMMEFIENSEKRMVIIQAPTGSGKSYVASSAVQWYGDGYILTATRHLQDQYLETFGHTKWFADLRGRCNYKCNLHYKVERKEVEIVYNAGEDNEEESPSGLFCIIPSKEELDKTVEIDSPKIKDCSNTYCTRKDNGEDYYFACNGTIDCKYYQALNRAVDSEVTSMNFAAGMCFLNYHPKFKGVSKRKVLVVDEAHDLEGQLTGFAELKITQSKMLEYGLFSNDEGIPDFQTVEEYPQWLEEMGERGKKLLTRIKKDDPLFEDLVGFMGKMEMIRMELSSAPEDYDVYAEKETRKDKHPHTLKIRPISIKKIFERYFLVHGVKVILLSATIPDPEYFAKILGFSDYDYIEIDSTFPVENRPIYKEYVGKYQYKPQKTQDEYFKKVALKLEEILLRYPDEKGIIQGISFSYTEKIMQHLKDSPVAERLISNSNKPQGKSAKQAFREHSESEEPTVLLTPSMYQGVDLIDDLSRFQVFIKVPKASWQDTLVRKKAQLIPGWYDNSTKITILQMYGRSIRHKDDYADTYLIDSTFDELGSMPKFFAEAIKEKQWVKESKTKNQLPI